MARVQVDGSPAVKTEPRAPTLSERIKAEADRVEYETDAAGRRIGVRRLTFLDMHEITLALGDDASNQAALSQAMMVASVVEIAGDQVSRPATQLEIKALMKRLDFHGSTAVLTAMGRFTPIGEAPETVKN